MHTATSCPVLRFITFALALGMYGCGGAHWQKADGSNASLAQDLEACRKEAQARLGGAGAFPPPVSNDPRFGPMGPSQADLRMQEAQALGFCMRQRGYELVRDEK